jgi:hypothetical protein
MKRGDNSSRWAAEPEKMMMMMMMMMIIYIYRILLLSECK